MWQDDASRQAISTALGYSSIVAWLFAQAPQVYENWKNGSVEGLALPFLVSWLAGDVTNLVGCILTHQLPFQTYLAIYFVFIDMCLMAQWIYYTHKNPVRSLPPLSEAYPHAQAPEHTHHSSHHHRHSHSRRPSKKRRMHSGDGSRIKGGRTDDMTQSWMSESSVAHSPASTRPASTRPTSSRQPSTRPASTRHNTFEALTRLDSSAPISVSSTQPPSPVVQERGRTMTRPPRPRPPMLETISGSPASGSPVPLVNAHPQQHPNIAAVVAAYDEEIRRGHTRTTSSSSRSRPPRRTTSMLFLSVGVFLTFSKLHSSPNTGPSTDVDFAGTAWATGGDVAMPPLKPSLLYLSHPTLVRRPAADVAVEPPLVAHDHDWEEPYPDYERFIGRTSAWLCTTLYLTSRLPQIWENFRRRSVGGLSMMLFIMAFTGNLLYVLSILSNPLVGSPGYLLESLPYLLGSGGTLCFDITIVLQSVMYSDKRKAAQERRRRRKERRDVDSEEAAALLHSETEADETDIGDGDGSTLSHFSSRQSSLGPRRSRSSRRTVSRKRSQSTELGQRSQTRAERGLLDDTPFEFQVDDSDENSVGRISGSTSRSRTRPSSLALIEEGESHMTIRS